MLARAYRLPQPMRFASVSLTAAVVGAIIGSSTPALAQGVSFAAPGRVPRAHDSDIGSATTGDPSLDYTLHCQGCHQAGGVGLAGSVPELRNSIAHVISLPGGREYVARVPGVAQSQLDDASVAALLNWIVNRFDSAHVPPDFRPFTAEEIAPLRRDPLVEATKARAALFAHATDPKN